MWGKRPRPSPEQLIIPDDIGEARAIREETRTELSMVRKQAPRVQRMTDVLINRQGKNHYIETLYSHVPRGAS